jgi:putative cardiolipin synthase
MPGSTRAFVAFLLLALVGCATLPASVERIESHALADTAHTRLGRAVAPLAAAHPG